MANKHLNIVSQTKKEVDNFELSDFIKLDDGAVFNKAEDLLSSLNLQFSLGDLLNLKNLDLMGLIRKVLDFFGLGWLVDLFLDLKDLFNSVINLIGKLISVIGGSLRDKLAILNALNMVCGGGRTNWGYTEPPTYIKLTILGLLFGILACFGVQNNFTDMLNKVDPITTIILTPETVNSNGVVIPAVTTTNRTHKFDSLLRDSLVLGMNTTKTPTNLLIDASTYDFTAKLGERNSIGRKIIKNVERDTYKSDKNSFDKINNGIKHLSGGQPDVKYYKYSPTLAKHATVKVKNKTPNISLTSNIITDNITIEEQILAI